MEDVWTRDEVDSPCIKICVMHPDAKICIGCYRTIDEISRWSTMEPEARMLLKQSLPERAGKLIGRRRIGRRARREKSGNLG